MNSRFATVLAILAALSVINPAAASAQTAAAGEGCVNSKCHSSMGKAEYVHGPVGAMVCSACHTESGAAHKDGKVGLVVDASQLCYFCHEEKQTAFDLPVKHPPVAEGECVGCHDPHQSNFKYQLRAQTPDLCYECHASKTEGKTVVHEPVATGQCQLCHDPHASTSPRLLSADINDHCLSCHQEKLDEMGRRHVHAPVADKCTNCHDAHASNVAQRLLQKPPELCFGCHPNILESVQESVDHPPAEEGECLTCHEAHASEQPRILVSPGLELCFGCHDQQQTEVLTARNRHGPVLQGDCTPCHNPHGSPNPRFLRRYFPPEFYNAYSTDKYALCFGCHNKDIALEEETTTLTDFRNGKRNLHFVHVNKEEKGRSCKACHGVHSSDQKKHIRTSVPFGTSWSYPIEFTKTEEGGSCVVGCHKPREYRRD